MKAKVLIVTPDAERAGRYASALGDAGFWITVAAEPEDAVQRARLVQPDCIVADVLTAQCAPELPRRLRAVVPGARVAALACEVFELDDGLRQRLGADALLPRGTAPAVLQLALLRLLGAKPAGEEQPPAPPRRPAFLPQPASGRARRERERMPVPR